MLSNWTLLHNIDIGFLPMIFQPDDHRPASVQANERYAHGGGWSPFEGFKLVKNGTNIVGISYDGDPMQEVLAWTQLATQTIYLFESGWVAAVDLKDGSYEISRMD